MRLFGKEHYDLMAQFESDCKDLCTRFEKEDQSLWPKGHIYQHGETNNLFLVYRRGYAYGILDARITS